MKKVMFISSTGGHLSEILQLKPMFKDYDFHLITEKDKMTENMKQEYGDKISFLVYGTRSHLFRYIFQFLYNCILTVIYYFKYRPDYIVSTGAHTAGPMCLLGKIFGSKIIFIETFANRTSKTMTGKLVYYFADLFIIQWEEMKELYPKAVVGGPIY